MTFVTKDGGDRATFDGGMVRDTEQGKTRWDLIPDDVFFDFVANDDNEKAINAYVSWKNTRENHNHIIEEIIVLDCEGDCMEYWKRVADLMARGAAKYGELNWMLGKTNEVHERYKKSLDRHFKQWLLGDKEEDHAAAVAFNLSGYLYTKVYAN